jgi:2-C-methyl-D-erythritol 4-phosphate cytidylyltransferase
VVAAGAGARMGYRKKPYLLLAGRPVLYHAIDRLRAAPCAAHTVVVVHADEFREGAVESSLKEEFGDISVVAGGLTRQASVLAGLRGLPEDVRVVLVHDAVRPLVHADVVARVASAARDRGAAIAAIPATETVKQVNERGVVSATPPRLALWYARTPQGFHTELLLRAHREWPGLHRAATDDAEMVERLGHPVHVVEDTPDNFKITTAQDLAVAEAVLRWQGRVAASSQA